MSDQDDTQTEGQPTELQLLKQRAKLMGLTFSNNISVDKLREKIAEKLGAEAPEDDADAPEEAEVDENDEPLFEAPIDTPVALQTNLEAAAAAPVPTADAPAPIKIADLVKAQLAQPKPEAAPVPPAEAKSSAPARKLTKAELTQKIRADLQRTEMALLRVRITNMDPKKKDLHGEIFTTGNKYLGTVKKFVPYGEATDNGYHLPKIIVDQLQARQFQDIRTVKDKRTGSPQVVSRWVREFAIEILPPLTEEELTNLAIAQAAAGSVD